MSPLEYMREYRLRKACMELIETEKSITEIASDCGFGSSSYFGKLFREHFNCSPVRYRGKWHDCNRNRHELYRFALENALSCYYKKERSFFVLHTMERGWS